MASKLLVVGGGLTGSLVAFLLAKRCPELSCTVWEKEGDAGGRMKTLRPPQPYQQVDTGAQYITSHVNEEDTPSIAALKEELFKELRQRGVLTRLTGKIEGERSSEGVLGNFVSPQGISSVPHYFLQQAKVEISYRAVLSQLTVDRSDGTALCRTADGARHAYSVVVLTMPVPEVLDIGQTLVLNYVSPEMRAALESVQYSCRYALCLFFNGDRQPPAVSWVAKYFDNPIVRFACWDKHKRDGSDSTPSPLLLHSSVPFALHHWGDDDEAVESAMLAAANELIPGLPSAAHSHLERWRYSQVHKGYQGSPGCVVLCESPLVVLTGDAMTHSNFEGCIKAANSTVDTIIGNLK